MIRKQHYITFDSPGTFFSESTCKPIDAWDTKTAVRMAGEITERYGAKPYGFTFSTSTVSDPIDDGEGGKLEVQPKPVAKSGMHFLGGKLLRFDDILDCKEKSILRGNMRGNGWPWVIENNNSWRATLPFEENACVVSEDGEIIERGTDAAIKEYREKMLAKWKDERGF